MRLEGVKSTIVKRNHGKGKVDLQKDKARWMELAELASTEQDPVKMLALIRELNELLDKKQRRLEHQPAPDEST
jgi:hypothetical protein